MSEYRGFTITYNPKPIPVRGHDWDFVHKDYNGPGDIRCGTASLYREAQFEIDDILEAIQVVAEEHRSYDD